MLEYEEEEEEKQLVFLAIYLSPWRGRCWSMRRRRSSCWSAWQLVSVPRMGEVRALKWTGQDIKIFELCNIQQSNFLNIKMVQGLLHHTFGE